MRIVYVITQGECGGAQRNVLESATACQSNGHAVFVITGRQEQTKDSWLFQELRKNGFEDGQLFTAPSLQRAIRIFGDIRAFFEIYAFIKKLRPHIVHLHSTKAGIISSIAGRCASVAVVYTVHGFVFSEPLSFFKKIFYISAEYVASMFRDATIVVSEFDARIGEKYRVIKKDKAIVIYNGIDTDKKKNVLAPSIAREYISFLISRNIEGSYVIGVVANLYATKGIEYLIDAIGLSCDAEPKKDVVCVVFGEGDLRVNLEERVREKHLGDVFFLPGTVPDAYRYLAGFDLTILPSVKEGFPYILLEAILAQVPIIATKVGGVPELQKYSAITLVQPADSKALSEKILEFSIDSRRKYIATTLPDVFTKKYMINRLAEVYEHVSPVSFVTLKDKTFLVTLPVFNEQEIIETTINKVSQYLTKNYGSLIQEKKLRLCVAINGSNDQTEDIVMRLEEFMPFLSHTTTTKKGRGAALDVTWSLAAEDVLIYIDADLAYDLSDLGKLIDSYRAHEEYDLVVASRRISGSVVKRSPVRTLLTEGYNRIIKLLFFNRFTDAQAGCKSIRKVAYLAIRDAIKKHDGWFFDTALLLYAEKRGYLIQDVSITCIDNRKWRLNIAGTVLYFLRNLLLLRIETLLKGWSRN